MRYILIIILLFSYLGVQAQNPRKVQMHMDIQRLHKGKVVKVNGNVYFKYTEGLMLVHYISPFDYMFFSNPKGEIKVYYNDKNEVYTDHDEIYSSQNDVLYSFLTNKATDLGLKEAGFKMQGSRREDGLLIITWIPPLSMAGKISKVEIAQENYLPIFSAFYNNKSVAFKKTYYSNYYHSNGIPFPQRIVEIDYLPKGDSIVSRKIYTNIQFDYQANSSYFNFTIPANAKPIKVKR
jgi:hypothetical protein